MKTYPMRIKDGKVYAEVTLRDVVERCDVSDLPMLTEVKRLYEENDKLRELCKTLYQLADESYVPFESVNRWMDDFQKAICAMRELGIEVDA